MVQRWLRILLVATIAAMAPRAIAQLAAGNSVVFASKEEARKFLTQSDDYIKSLSPFDRRARVGTDKAVSEAEFLEFVGRSATDWPESDRRRVAAALDDVGMKFADYALPFPATMQFIRTTGDEEAGAAYTRGAAVILPRGQLGGSQQALERLVCHELFHVLSRANPELRQRLYGAIGFVRCEPIELPEELNSRRITNPDGIGPIYGIRLTAGGEVAHFAPLLLADVSRFNPGRGAFFSVMQFKWLKVQRSGDPATQPVAQISEPVLLDMAQVSGFFEQAGRNTNYTIHPDEILADNFAMLMLAPQSARSPEVLAKIKAVLTAKAQSPTTAPAP